MITHWIKPLFYLVGISAINVPRITHPENRPASDRNEILQFSFISTEYTNSKHDLISTCEIVYKYPKNAPSNTFHCKTENGLELDLFAGEKLDREEIAHYKLDFKGYNADKELIAESKNSLTVEVLDENDNSPEFIVESLQGKVKESAAIGTPVLTVKATDKDDPRTECWSESKSPSACIRFSETLNCKMKTVKNSQFFKNCDQSYFKIDKHGVISTKQRIDAEAVLEFSLEIKAMDGRESALSHEVSEKVFISVEDSNDHRPEFRKKMYRFKVKENIGVNDPIGNVYASDEDRDVIHNKVVYMVDDNFSDNFEFKDGNKLFLKTGFKLDFENLKKFPKHRKEIKIRAQNEKLPKTHMFDEATVVIDILDVNEPPELVGAGLVLQTKENGKTASYSKTSGIVTVRDIDFLGNQTVKFGIEDPEGWFRLSEEKTLAQKVTNSDFKHYQVKISLKTGIKVDRECANCENGEYVFHVLASDNYNPAAVGRIQVQLIIEDVNDNAPEFETPVHRICSRNQGFTEPMSVIPGLENVEIVDQDSKVNGKPFFVEYLPGKSSSGLKSLISFENMGESLKFSSIEQDLPLGRFDLVFRMKDGKSLSALRRLTVETCSCTMRGICPKAVLVVAGGEGDKDWTIWLWTILGMVLCKYDKIESTVSNFIVVFEKN